ncbi:MAG: YggS family pyridoxal phosphate enzyme [bacterium]
MIEENIFKINNIIKQSAAKSGRNLEDITLLAASKTRTPDEIIKAYDCGINVFGENYVQEFLGKYNYFKNLNKNSDYFKNLKWHLIGKLQKNKVKYITEKVSLIHSVDNFELAKLIDKFWNGNKNHLIFNEKNRINDADNGDNDGDENNKNNGINNIENNIQNKAHILIEINIAEESTKSGIDIENAKKLISDLNYLKNTILKGFMTMPPYSADPEDNRMYFRALKDFLGYTNKNNLYKTELTELSMGTSGDFSAAIEEGATIVRLGTVIFGERIYTYK